MSDVFDARKDSPAIRAANAAFIDALMKELLPPMRMAARGCGYALAVHGTLARDVDLVAAPWTSAAYDADQLLKALVGVIAGVTGRCHPSEWTDKPHGRRSVLIIHAAADSEIDLSVMPLGREARE